MHRGNGETISNVSWNLVKGSKTLLWQNLVWLSDTDAWDDTDGISQHV